MATWAQWGLQDALSPVMEEFVYFNDFTTIILCFITSYVLYIILLTMGSGYINMLFLENQAMECIWTLVPAFVLVEIAIPSLTLLYMLDESSNSQVTMKAVGHQWFWSYEYSDSWMNFPSVSFSSYMKWECNLGNSDYRMLDTDNRAVFPISTSVRLLVTSSDVLHAWTVPSLGVKVDACPGRLNQLNFLSYRPGVFFGQCSEICGAQHSFMPIVVEFVLPIDFFWWALGRS